MDEQDATRDNQNRGAGLQARARQVAGLHANLDPLDPGLRLDAGEALFKDRPQREPRDFGGGGPGVDLAQVQQVTEQVEHVMHRVPDRPEALLYLGVGVALEMEFEQLRRQDHGVQRGPRVVRERRDQA